MHMERAQLQTSIIKQHHLPVLIKLQSTPKSEITLITLSVYRNNFYCYLLLAINYFSHSTLGSANHWEHPWTSRLEHVTCSYVQGVISTEIPVGMERWGHLKRCQLKSEGKTCQLLAATVHT